MKTRTKTIKSQEKELMCLISQIEGVNWIDYNHANEQIKISVNHGFTNGIVVFLETRCKGIFKFDKEVDNHGYSYIYADYDLNAAPCPPRCPGRPISNIPQKEKKHSYSVSLSENRRDELCKRFGNLTKALDSIQLGTTANSPIAL